MMWSGVGEGVGTHKQHDVEWDRVGKGVGTSIAY